MDDVTDDDAPQESKPSVRAPLLRSTFSVRYYVSAYIDLLGLSSRLLEFERAVTTNDPLDAALASIGHVARLRLAFEHYYAPFDEPAPRPDSVPADWVPTPEQARFIGDLGQHRTVFQYFGDCIVLSVPLEQERPLRTWHGLFVMFSAVAMASLTLLTEAQVCRGGIELGISCEPYAGEVLGASVVRAYKLESQAARFPRIVVGAELLSFIERAPWPCASQPERELQRHYADAIRSWITTDADGLAFVHFLSVRGQQLAEREVLDAAAQFVFDRSRQRGGPEEKYDWLRGYFSAHPRP